MNRNDSSNRYQLVESLYQRAVDLPVEGRSEFLSSQCAGDRGLHEEVESLLRHYAAADGRFLSSPAHGLRAAHRPERIGRYRVIDMLGEGGMGVVYRAEQDHPRREVALKLIRPGLANEQSRKRLQFEAEILGQLQHAGIAHVYDAGVAEVIDEGGAAYAQPFFAMELVHGQALRDFATAANLNLRQRLELMAQVCDAVQHAHQHGVIHRDLKPANILVNAAGQPKVVDFGVARATGAGIQPFSIETAAGRIVGTLAYMSPEQIRGAAPLNTRSDVYALGSVLYEVLSGAPPFELSGLSLPEAARRICEEEPRPLSELSPALRGDVATIVSTAMAKDVARRYPSAAELGDDIRRFLRGDPIAARRDSTLYLLRRKLGRYRGVAALVGLLVVSLASFAIYANSQARAYRALAMREGQARREAEAAETLANKAKELAEERGEETRQIADFQTRQFGLIDVPGMGARLRASLLEEAAAAMRRAGLEDSAIEQRRKSLKELISGVNLTNVALNQLDQEIFAVALEATDRFSSQPRIKAQLLQVLANTLRDLGLLESAMAPQVEALALRRQVLGDMHPGTFTSINNMGYLYERLDKMAEAEAHYREAVEKRRQVLGSDHRDTLFSISNLGCVLRARGKLEEAEGYLREALDKRAALLGDEHPDTLASYNNLGVLLRSQGKLAQAEGNYRKAMDIGRRVLGDDHPDTLNWINNVGFALAARGKRKEAEGFYREALEKRRRVLGDEHPDTLVSISNLGQLLLQERKFEEAEALLREVLEKRRRLLGEEHESTLVSVINLGGLMQTQRRYAEAEAHFRQALETLRRVHGDEHPRTLTAINNVGVALRLQGKLEESERYQRAALATRQRVLPEDHPDVALSRINVALTLTKMGRLAEAEELLLLAESALTKDGESPKNLKDCLRGMYELYDAWHVVEPGGGYRAKAKAYRSRFRAVRP